MLIKMENPYLFYSFILNDEDEEINWFHDEINNLDQNH